MEEPEEIVIQKRQAAIKLAKNLEPFNYTLGEEFDAIYIETLTEDIKQCAREIKKLATVWDHFCKQPVTAIEALNPPEVEIDGESDRVTKLMRRYSTRITDVCRVGDVVKRVLTKMASEGKIEAAAVEVRNLCWIVDMKGRETWGLTLGNVERRLETQLLEGLMHELEMIGLGWDDWDFATEYSDEDGTSFPTT
jgi:hypothetical protein